MPQRPCFISALYLASFPFVSRAMEILSAQEPRSIKNHAGLQLVVATENAQLVLHIVLPGQSESNHAIEVIFPEHVTARRRGSSDSVQLYMFRPEPRGEQTDMAAGRSIPPEFNANFQGPCACSREPRWKMTASAFTISSAIDPMPCSI